MKTVITATGNNLDATIDSHFGRCAYFIFYDSITKGIEFLPNPNKDMIDGAGLAAVNLINSRKVEQIITGELGSKVKPLLDSLKIQVIIYKNKEKNIQDIITLLNHK